MVKKQGKNLYVKKSELNQGGKKIKIEIDLPDDYEKYFEYLEVNFNIKKKEYLEEIIKKEINSRNDELGIF